MPHWMIKAAIQGGLSALPQPQRINRVLQRHVSGRLRMTEARVLGKFRQCQRHMAHWSERPARSASAMPHALELGTGWYPVVPIGLFLLGAREVSTVDIQGLMGDEAAHETAACYLRLIDQGRLGPVLPERVERLRAASHETRSGAELLERLAITPHIADARALPLSPASVDLFVSNNTLEHIPGEAILTMFREFGRVAAGHARMSHFVDMADHYALFDDSITVFNYMRYSEDTWRLFNNELHYQNRLRLSDYRELHREAGWRIVREEPTEGSREQLARVPLDRQFCRYDEPDLLAYESWFVSRLQAMPEAPRAHS